MKFNFIRPNVIIQLILILKITFATEFLAQSQYNSPIRFQPVSETVSYKDEAQPLQLAGGTLMMIYTADNSLMCTRSGDGGKSWDKPDIITSFNRISNNITLALSSCTTETGRIVLIYSLINNLSSPASVLQYTYSDDNGKTWQMPQSVYNSMTNMEPFISKDSGNKLWISGRNGIFFLSTDNGAKWQPKSVGFTAASLISLKDSSLLVFSNETVSGRNIIQYRKSTDQGQNWGSPVTVSPAGTLSEERPRAVSEPDGTLWLIYQVKRPTQFSDIAQYDISMRKSIDSGSSWGPEITLTRYAGNDSRVNVSSFNSKPFIAFVSDRYFAASFQNGLTPYGKQVWASSADNFSDAAAPAAILSSSAAPPAWATPTKVTINAASHTGIITAEITYRINSGPQQFASMFDDGVHNDGLKGDNIWSGELPALSGSERVTFGYRIKDNNSSTSYFYGSSFLSPYNHSSRWLSIGSLQDWYSPIGSEREEGIANPQTGALTLQTGWQWPADHMFMDLQNWKGLWLGAKNFTDRDGYKWENKVVHAGPRVPGTGELYPVLFYMKSKYPKPVVEVDGKVSSGMNDSPVDIIDPSLTADREIVNVCNTQLGLTMTRRIFQFTNPYHDNYIIHEYTFKNTGDTDADATTIELPGQTLDSVMIFMQARIAPSAYSRYAIGNSTGWGMNTTIDTRGDGLYPDPAGEDFRAQFAWHGRYQAFTLADNIGGPIWQVQTNISKGDTVGRLAAFQFAGLATLYADKSAVDKSDDKAQPSTTSTFDSDGPLMSNNDAANVGKMALEYAMMSGGHDKRHLDKIGETNIIMPIKDPSTGSGGGYSFGNGYGPYTLKFGESIKIIVCQAAAGMGWEAGEIIGREYKRGKISAFEKNKEVMKGKDSLFTAFRRARTNMKSGWNIPQPPAPPKTFKVAGINNTIKLSWTLNDENDPAVKGFQIFRAAGRFDSTYHLIAELPGSARSYFDSAATRGTEYYYNIRIAGSTIPANSELNIPSVRLTSSKFYTQTYLPAKVGTTGIEEASNAPREYKLYNNYPNPFNPETTIRYSLAAGSHVSLKIYDMLGREVITLVDGEKAAGVHSIKFNAASLSSGIYIYRITAGSFTDLKKLMLLK